MAPNLKTNQFPAQKFIKNTIYVTLTIFLVIFLLIQPYNLFCRIEKSCQPIKVYNLLGKKVGKQKMIINFIATNQNLLKTIEFYPEISKLEVQNGKNIAINYLVKNVSNKEITISSEFNVEPKEAEQYLEKIECLCLKNQSVKAKQEIAMPINLRINPDIEKDPNLAKINLITISYQPYLVK